MRRKLAKLSYTPSKYLTDELYVTYLSLRSLPVAAFLGDEPPAWVMPITSMREDKLLKELGLPRDERNQIEGLSSVGRLHGGLELTEEQLSSRAIARLATNPPHGVGNVQRRTANWMLRLFPLGARFSGSNMSPLPGWLAGAQGVCINMSNNDLAMHLHFALFNGSSGFVLKPIQLRSIAREGNDEVPPSWPARRALLHRTTFSLLSLHQIPKRGERRPRYKGSRAQAHKYEPQLSGTAAPPDNAGLSSGTGIDLSLHSIAGALNACHAVAPCARAWSAGSATF